MILEKFSLKGKAALVTGSSRGLGAAIAGSALLALMPAGPMGLGPSDLGFMLGCLVIVAAVVALGPTLAN